MHHDKEHTYIPYIPYILYIQYVRYVDTVDTSVHTYLRYLGMELCASHSAYAAVTICMHIHTYVKAYVICFSKIVSVLKMYRNVRKCTYMQAHAGL